MTRSSVLSPPRASASGPIRVLLVITTSDVGGTETFLHNLATGLDAVRFAPRVVSLCPPGRTAARIVATGVPVESLEMGLAPRLSELFRGARHLAARIDHLEIDLVYGFLYRAQVLAALGGRWSRRRPAVVVGQRSLTPMGGRAGAFLARWTRRFCQRTVAVSEAAAQVLVRGEGVSRERITVIANGVDTSRFVPADAGGTRQAFGLEDDAVVVGGVGRLAVEKGFHHLIAAVAEGVRGGAHLSLVLVGDGPERQALASLARQQGIAERVCFLGVRRDLETVYPAFDIFALSSLEEGSPNVVLEAMACSRPVVATAVGGVPELVTDEQTALLVEAARPEALAAALVRLADNQALRNRLGNAGRARVEEAFTIPRMVARHEELFTTLIKG